MLRIFNKSNRMFQLEDGGDKVLVAPRKVLSLEERFTNDITYKVAVEAGDIEELTAAADNAVAVEQTKEEKPLEKIQHPDTMETTDAKRKQAAATGKVTRSRKKG